MTQLFMTPEEIDRDPQGRETVVTIGAFDGLHRGHLSVIGACLEKAGDSNRRSLVITFSQHPLEVLAPPHAPHLLTPPQRKIELLSETGADAVACLPFTESFAAMEPSRFVNLLLIDQCGATGIVYGYDFHFGRGGRGAPEMIREIGQARGVETWAMGPLTDGDTPISSTRIRNALTEGHIAEANRLLGRDFDVEGVVVEGFQRGRMLAFPTANLLTAPRQLVPMAGVYAIRVYIPEDKTRWNAMANVGPSPTFGDGESRIEAHLFDFRGDLYGKTIRVEFIHRMRPILRYESAEALIHQLKNDEVEARIILARP